MIYVYIFMIAMGALPMTMFLIRRKKYYHVIKNGTPISAQVTDVRTIHLSRGGTYDRVIFAYLPAGSNQYYSGQFAIKVGKYKRGDHLDIFYLPQEPQKNAVPGSKGDTAILIFMIAIFLFVLFACYKINEMVGDQHFIFNP
jgi:hypothetical protein